MRPAIFCALSALTFALATASAQTGIATVEFDDQTSDGTYVIVQQVTLSNGGFVVIHDGTGNTTGAVVGYSEYLGVGTHDDVRVNITLTMSGNVTLIAMPHFDSNGNESFDFESSGGQDDGPYQDGGIAVTESAQVTVEAADTGTVGADRDDDEDAPGFALVAVLAVLAAAAVVMRRR